MNTEKTVYTHGDKLTLSFFITIIITAVISPLDPKLISALFHKHNLCSCFRARNQFSHPNKTTDKIVSRVCVCDYPCMSIYTRAVCKVRGLTLLHRIGTLWRCGDGLFFEVPSLASDARLTTLHPILVNGVTVLLKEPFLEWHGNLSGASALRD
jgi:hypothetical protein